MKKLLFIFTLAAICAFATSSFKTVQSANDEVTQTLVISSENVFNTPEEVKNDEKKKKQTVTSNCCPAKTQKTECTEAKQKICTDNKVECPVKKADCPEEKKCPKK